MKLLIVDDEQIVLDTLVNLLNWVSYGIDHVYTALNGKTALNIFHKENPDILITDLKMPEMDGIELISRIRSEDESIHILIISAYTDFEDARSAIALNVVDYLLKPLRLAEFEKMIKRITQNIVQIETQYASQSNNYKKIINDVLNYANKNYSNPDLTLLSIAKHFFVDYYYLSKLFKKETGKLFSTYLRDLRIQHAKIMLQHTGTKIYEVCTQVGYRNIRYFRKQFKEATGLSPSEYINETKKIPKNIISE